MKLLENIVSQISYYEKEKIVKKVIVELQKMDKLFIDKDNCLENLWEEFCVLCQDENIEFDKDKITGYIFNLIEEHYNELDRFKKVAIWIKTTDGVFWHYDNKDKSLEIEDTPISFESCKEDFFKLIFDRAKEFDNDNIYRFLYLDGNEFEDNLDEDDKDIIYE